MNNDLMTIYPTQGMDVWCVYVLSCVQAAALRRADHSSKESYRLWKTITELNKRPGPWMGRKSHWKEEIIAIYKIINNQSCSGCEMKRRL
jgi:hypothetical protein